MPPLPAIDGYMAMGVAIVLLLGACVLILYGIRDRRWAPPRRVTRAVWCPSRNRRAIVDFTERVDTGLVVRTVEQCSLLDEGERCSGPCAHGLGAA
jgi:hypothetical protein